MTESSNEGPTVVRVDDGDRVLVEACVSQEEATRIALRVIGVPPVIDVDAGHMRLGTREEVPEESSLGRFWLLCDEDEPGAVACWSIQFDSYLIEEEAAEGAEPPSPTPYTSPRVLDGNAASEAARALREASRRVASASESLRSVGLYVYAAPLEVKFLHRLARDVEELGERTHELHRHIELVCDELEGRP
jgi:hypothetical protein